MTEFTIIRDNIKEAEETMGKYIKQGFEPISIAAPEVGYLVILMKKSDQSERGTQPSNR